ncbi:MAG: response regulator transcription factor [Pelosinus sp.]|nr:response regulator transcription factor [Pelosinus sp.]
MKVLLVDDHSLVLEGIRNFLAVNDIDVVGTAQSGVEALYKIESLEPNLILMDVQMAGGDGIEATRMIKAEYPDMKIVMLTASEDDDTIFAALQAGAVGYLLKNMKPEHFLWQLNSLNKGDMPLAPSLAKRLLQEFNRRQQAEHKNNAETELQLTDRQTEILQLLTEGLTYRVMAQRLDLKEATIKYHIKEILNKLHLTNRAQLLLYASRMVVNEDK